jgi:hypothetical protein
MVIPTVGADTDNWGNDLNSDLGLIDNFAGKLMPGGEVTLGPVRKSWCFAGKKARFSTSPTR